MAHPELNRANTDPCSSLLNHVLSSITPPSMSFQFLLPTSALFGEGNGNSLQYSCLGNPMDRGAWWAIVHGLAKSQIQLKQISTHALGSTAVRKAKLSSWRSESTAQLPLRPRLILGRASREILGWSFRVSL